MVSSLITVIIFVTIFCLFYLLLDFFKARGFSLFTKIEKVKKAKDRATIIRESNRKLSSDPKNYPAIKQLADLYYDEGDYTNALPLYEMTFELPILDAKSDQAENGFRYGSCALKLKRPEDAIKGLLLANAAEPDSFEINFTLGAAFAENDDFEKSIAFYKKTILLNPEYQPTYQLLGMSLFKSKKYREALPYIKQALESAPDDKGALFALAQCFLEVGNSDDAQNIFSRLRIDSEYGPQASLFSGEYHLEHNNSAQALIDFQIGFKHPNIDDETKKNLMYNLAHCYLEKLDIVNALPLLTELNETFPNFKDVSKLYQTYSELHKNMNLQIYLIGAATDFVSLCKLIAKLYFKEAVVKITSVASGILETEISATIKTDKWEDSVIFRFYRSTDVTGELCIRELYGKVRDSKAGKGICFTAGTFSEEARRYVDVRPIDLVNGDKLTQLLNEITTKIYHPPAAAEE
ncbi:MAG: tetratricopeptide repeat protein [Treponemataceae bacterium]